MQKSYFVYILKNNNDTLYIGVTGNITKRIWEHKQELVEGFTKKYHIHSLVYLEEYLDPIHAIERENTIKKWNRMKKLNLIKSKNPLMEEMAI